MLPTIQFYHYEWILKNQVLQEKRHEIISIVLTILQWYFHTLQLSTNQDHFSWLFNLILPPYEVHINLQKRRSPNKRNTSQVIFIQTAASSANKGRCTAQSWSHLSWSHGDFVHLHLVSDAAFQNRPVVWFMGASAWCDWRGGLRRTGISLSDGLRTFAIPFAEEDTNRLPPTNGSRYSK